MPSQWTDLYEPYGCARRLGWLCLYRSKSVYEPQQRRPQLFSQPEPLYAQLICGFWRGLLQRARQSEAYRRTALDGGSQTFRRYSERTFGIGVWVPIHRHSGAAMGSVHGARRRQLDTKTRFHGSDADLRIVFTWLQGWRRQSARCGVLDLWSWGRLHPHTSPYVQT